MRNGSCRMAWLAGRWSVLADLDKFTEENDFTDHALKRAWKDPSTRYHILEDMSVLLMELVGWLGIYLSVLYYIGQTETEDVLGLLALPVFYAVSYAVRRLVTALWGVLLGHALLALPVIGIMARSAQIAPEITTFYLAVVIGCFIGAIAHYRRGQVYMSYTGKWYLAIEVVVIFFWGVFTKNTELKNIGMIFGIVLILFHMWCSYLERMNDYLAERGAISNLSKHLIFDGSTRMVTRLLLLIFVCMLAAFYFQNDGLFAPIKDYVLFAIRKMLLWIAAVVRWVKNLWGDNRVSDTSSVGDMEENFVTMDSTVLLDHPIMAVLGAIPYLVLLAFAIREFMRWLKRRKQKMEGVWGRKLEVPDEIEELGQAETESFWEKWKQRIFRTNQEKVRFLFKLRVKRGLRDAIRASATARALGEQVQEENGVSMEPLTDLYEAARYSEREITAAEIKSARKS